MCTYLIHMVGNYVVKNTEGDRFRGKTAELLFNDERGKISVNARFICVRIESVWLLVVWLKIQKGIYLERKWMNYC